MLQILVSDLYSEIQNSSGNHQLNPIAPGDNRQAVGLKTFLMKRPIIFMFLILVVIQVSGQDTVKNHPYNYATNNIFVEVAGNSYLFGSLNYERVIIKRGNFYFNGRIGIGYGNFSQTSIISLPIGFNGIIQIHRAFAWEIGLGFTLMQITRSDASPRNSVQEYEQIPALIVNTGFRIQDKDGFLFRIDFTPFFNPDKEGQLLPGNKLNPWAGLSIGYRIGKNKK